MKYNTLYRSQYFSSVKSQLSLAWRAPQSLEETWESLVRRLRRRLGSTVSYPGGGVPSVHFRDIYNNGGNIPAAALDKVNQSKNRARQKIPIPSLPNKDPTWTFRSLCLSLVQGGLLYLTYICFPAKEKRSHCDKESVGQSDSHRDGVQPTETSV